MSTLVRTEDGPYGGGGGASLGGRQVSTVVFWIGLALCAAPTLIANYRESWSTEQGQHAPLVLAIGLWLLWRRWPAMRLAGATGSPVLATLGGVAAAGVYVVGRIAGQFLLESYGFYLLALAAIYAQVGWSGLRRGGFPLIYLVLGLPPPYALSFLLTSHLRLWVTEAAVAVYRLFGVEIVRDGLNILVDQYNLAVKEACSGMNSLISLSAIGLVYIHLRRMPPGWYYLLMVAPIVGMAVFANFVRICVLIGLTHVYGDAVAQSYLHESAGLLTFAVALISVIGIDAILARILRPAHLEEA